MIAPTFFATDKRDNRRGFAFDTSTREAMRSLWHEAKQEARDTGFRGWMGPVVDLITGDAVWVRPAPCGAGCYCDANYRTTTPRIENQFAIFTEAYA